MLLYIDNHLVAELSGGSWNESVDPATVQVHPANFKLLMDVELKVSLRFGQRQMPLREVLELTSGSVIELDRQVDEPVELLLDGKVIARGRAVIVDGNYGLRVTEIPQPMTSHFIG
jgi:flagellar motor switch protein FliN/FliY